MAQRLDSWNPRLPSMKYLISSRCEGVVMSSSLSAMCGLVALSCNVAKIGTEPDSGIIHCSATIDRSAWTGNSGYQFESTSFGCEADPIEHKFYIDLTSFEAGRGISQGEQAETDFIVAKDAWNLVGANVTVRHPEGYTVEPGYAVKDTSEPFNQVFMEDDYERAQVAYARAYPWTTDGRTVDCDIKVFSKLGSGGTSVPIDWGLNNSPGSSEAALVRAFMHELGHCLGVSDNEISDSIMYGMGPGLAGHLSQDDRDALSFIYGPP